MLKHCVQYQFSSSSVANSELSCTMSKDVIDKPIADDEFRSTDWALALKNMISESINTISFVYSGKLCERSVVPGPHAKFEVEQYETIMRQHGMIKHRAINAFWVNLKEFSMQYAVCIMEIVQHAEKYYNAFHAVDNKYELQWNSKFVLDVVQFDLSAPCVKGEWRKLTGDLELYAVLYQLAVVIKSLSTDETSRTRQHKARDMLMNLLCM